VHENRVLRRLYGPKRDKVTGEWRELYDKELYDLYSSSNTVWVIKSRRMRWEGHVAYTGDRRGAHQVMVGKPEGERERERERDHLEDLRTEGRIILICIFRMWGREYELASFGGQGQVVGSCECCDALLGSIKCGEFLD